MMDKEKLNKNVIKWIKWHRRVWEVDWDRCWRL